MTSIVHAVRDNGAPPDATALVANGRAWTYRELLAAAERVAAALARRDVPGEGVVARLSDPAATAALVLGCDLAGVPLVHRDAATPGSVAGPVARDGEAGLDGGTVLSGEPPLRLTGEGRSDLPDGVPAGAHVFLTSGSTGAPTGVVRTAAAVLADARRVGRFLGYGPDAPVAVAAPLFHAYGFNYGLVAPLVLGAPVRFCPVRSVPSRLLAAVRDHGARTLVALPFHYALLAQAAAASDDTATPPGLEVAVSAGAPLGPGVAAAVAERFTFRLHNCYGSSEAGAVTLAPVSGGEAEGWIGVPLPGVAAEVVPPDDDDQGRGELLLATSSLAFGRIGPAGLVPLDVDGRGRYRTGDLALPPAPDGALRLAGRIGSLINVAGKKVAPAEIERVLAGHPAVADVQVSAAPDRAHGQVPVAEVVLRAPAPDLVPWCRERLAPHQVPRRITEVRSIPRSATGKPIRREVAP
ncbi:fatty acid--CoA ligase family protein [Streptomyces sp. BE20]|uniref:class I adenylate-forming enzyme family protein n=1 Tax=Streptomyces sp. BE20 TaxID=3002525 RepID=UPI002E79C99B|nr:fatty acid--CoA ligase family protein [Streptomyces sp. BE20]MEE1822821.1 fatty acid--CoA ligase family protein [Streptomyces sp. BE20]